MPLKGYKQTEEHRRKRGNLHKGFKHSEETKKMIGEIHKGNHYVLGKHWKLSNEIKQKFSKIHKELGHHPPIVHDEEAWQWKGDNVSYTGLHIWISKKLGKPTKCEHCNKEGYYIFYIRYGKSIKKWSIEWANKSRKYLRELSDWLPLCHKCHSIYDNNHPYSKSER